MQHGGQWRAGPLTGAQDHTFLGARGFRALALEIFEKRGVAARTLHDRAEAAPGEAPQLVEV